MDSVFQVAQAPVGFECVSPGPTAVSGACLCVVTYCLPLSSVCSFTQAMLSQPKMEGLENPTTYCLGLALLGVGTIFVLSSFFALGFTGTFLGKRVQRGRVEWPPPTICDIPGSKGDPAISILHCKAHQGVEGPCPWC